MDLSNKNILHVKKVGKEGPIEYLQFKKLLEFKELVHCYTLSANNLDFFTKNSNLDESYNKICDTLNIKKENIVRPKQNHTDCIKNVENMPEKSSFLGDKVGLSAEAGFLEDKVGISTKSNSFENVGNLSKEMKYLENVDGLLTNKANINLMLTFADCTPILLYDPVKNVIGNIHSGWRGTVQKIGQKAVRKMVEDYGSIPADIIACIGPCIGKCHFEVDEDVKETFEKTFNYLRRNDDIIEKNKIIDGKQKYHIDTTLINRLILEKVGIKPENIIESGICTVCNSEYMHSYRAMGDKAGRNATVISLKLL